MICSSPSRFARQILAAAFFSSVLAAASSAVQVWNYPDTVAGSPCLTTLQACVDATASGDTIVIRNQLLQSQSATITHSLTIFPVDTQFHPAIGSIKVISNGPSSLSFLMTGITVGRFEALQYAGNFSLTLTNNLFGSYYAQTPANPNLEVIYIRSDVPAGTAYGTNIMMLNNSVFRDGPSARSAISLSTSKSGDTLSAMIQQNGIYMDGDISSGSAIDFSSSGRTANVDILQNQIRSNGANSRFNAGITLSNPGDNIARGKLSARVFNNLVVGQGRVAVGAGSYGGIALFQSQDGPIDIAVVNNTIVDGEIGVFVGATAAAGTQLTGGLFNNIFARNRAGFFVSKTDLSSGFANSNNLLFGNGSALQGLTVGPNTRTGDPAFKDNVSFELTAASDAIDHGVDPATIAALGNPTIGPGDVYGGQRVRGSAIDIGAVEAKPIVSIAASSVSLPDNGSVLTITVTANDPAPITGYSVRLSGVPAVGGQIAATTCASRIEIPKGATSATCTITASNNTTPGESAIPVTVGVSAFDILGDEYIVSTTASSVSITIVDDDPPVVVPTLGRFGLLALICALPLVVPTPGRFGLFALICARLLFVVRHRRYQRR